MDEALPLFHEPWTEVWKRRALSVPGLLGLTAAGLALSPVALPVLALRDLLRGDPRLPAVRAFLALEGNFVVHSAGLFWLGGVWLKTEAFRRSDAATIEADAVDSYEVEVTLGNALLSMVKRLFHVKVRVRGLEVITAEPSLILSRHSSLIDPLLLVALTREKGLRIRYVAKRDLLWDPCIDILGHRVPMAFVWRKGQAHETDLEGVVHLADHLEQGDAVLVFPEGTRFSEEKKAKALAALAADHPELAERARHWKHVLPPRPGGTLALLDVDHDHDVIVCAHTGLEGVSHARDFIDGTLLDRTIDVEFWRYPRAEIPDDPAAQRAWLYDVMARIEAWVEAKSAAGGT